MATSQLSSELPAGFVADPAELPEGFAVDTPKKKVGVFESMLRTAAQAAAPVVRTLGLAESTLQGALRGPQAQEKTIARTEETVQGMNEAYAPAEGEEFSSTGEVLGGAASMPIAVLGQGVAPGINRAAEVLKRGGTGAEATQAGAVSGIVNQALLALPTFLGGKVAEKIGGGAVRQAIGGAATGAAVNVPASIAGKAAENAALPEGDQFKDLTQEPLDTKDLLVQAGLSAALGAAGAGGARIKAKKAAKAATPTFPADKFEDLGEGKYRTPNGVEITKEEWGSSTKRVRDGWLEEAPKEEKPAEPKVPNELDRLKEEHPSGPVADALREVEAKRTKAAKVKADAEELRRAAEQTTDPEIKKVLNSRADKINPPEKIPVGETKEGQPEIKTEQPKRGEIPAGKATEVPEPYAGEKIPTGEAKEVTRSGAEPAVPVGETKELYTPPEKRNAADQVTKPQGSGEELQNGNRGGQAAEASSGDLAGRAAEGGRGQAIQEGGKGPEALSEHKDLTFPQIDETLLNQARREPVIAPTPPKRAIERGAEAVRKTIDDAVKAGKLDKDTAEMANWVLDRNPRIGRNLGLTVEPKHEQGALGAYNPTQRVVRLFKESSGPNAAHEIMHHTERMMPHEVQQGIQKEWRRNLERSMKDATPEQQGAMRDAQEMITGASQEVRDAAQKRMVKAFQDGVLTPKDHYHLVDPSEFWAVNASRILSERFTSRGSWRSKAIQWMREFIEKAKGTLGLRSDSAVLKALDDVLASKGRSKAGRQIVTSEKLAVREREGEQLAVGPSKPAKRELPEETKGLRIPGTNMHVGGERDTRRVFDSLHPIERAQRESGINFLKNESKDVRLAARTMLGKVQLRSEDLEKQSLAPLKDQLTGMKKAGLTLEDADDYLKALHAPERNREITKINPKMQDGGSGLTYKQAGDILKSFTPEQKAHLNAVAKTVHEMNNAKLDGMLADGVISKELHATLKVKYKNYVPLKTLDAEAEFTGVGRGFQMWDNDIKRSFGRTSQASSPIAASIMDAQTAIIRGERARVNKSIWEFAHDSKGADFVTPYEPLKRKGDVWVDEQGNAKQPPKELLKNDIGPDGKTRQVIDPLAVQKHTVPLVINGELKHVFVKDPTLKEALATAGTPEQMGEVTRALSQATRTFARTLTEWNPAFPPVNQVKDVVTAAIRAKRFGIDATAFTPAKILKAQADVVNYMRGKETKGSTLYREMQEAGAKTGAYGLTDFEQTLHNLKKAGAEIGYAGDKSGARIAVFGDAAAKGLGAYNEVFEYSTRLAAYRAAREKGMSPARAANVARQITVDFNVSGLVGRKFGPLYVFVNASLQGLAGDLRDLRSPLTRNRMLAMVGVGMAVQAYNELAGGINPETGEKNIASQFDPKQDSHVTLLNPFADKGDKSARSGVSMPVPVGVAGGLYAIGRRLWRLGSEGDWKREAEGIAAATVQALMPIRFAEGASQVTNVLQGLSPALIRAPVDVAVNSNQFGMPIVPDTHGDKSAPPYHMISRSTTSDLMKGLSKGINAATGGNDVTPGYAQQKLGGFVSPEALEYMIGYYSGGLGQTVLQSKNIVKNAVEGKSQEINKMPLVRRFAFSEPESYVSRRYNEIKPGIEYANDYRKLGREKEADPKALRALDEFRSADKELTVLFKRLKIAKAAGEDPEQIQADIKAAQSRVIRAYNGQPAP